ncbi:MAG: molybdopterin cofactor-binding domain-containing protein [Pseudomonadota bacterium]
MALTRRDFLKRSGWVAGGLTVVATSSCSLVPPLPTFSTSDDADSVTWVQLRSDGRIRFWSPRAEMGQGINTGLSHLVAEELDLPLDRIDCRYQSTAVQAPCQMTVGSQSIENYRGVTARAAARLRDLLQARAAVRLGGVRSDWQLVSGGFERGNGNRVAFADLIESGEDSVQAVETDATPVLLSDRPRSELKWVGRSLPAMQLGSVVRGEETYSRDVRVPGMRYGRVAKPPQLGGLMLGFDRAGAEAVPGVDAVVEFDGQVGVVAATPGAAARGLTALAVRWQPMSREAQMEADRPVDIDEAIDSGELDHIPIDKGDIAGGASAAETRISVRYDSPMAAHAAMEPRSAVVSVSRNADGKAVCEVWSATQDPWLVQDTVRRAAGVSRKRTVVHNHRIGGAFGGRVLCQAAIEAAWLSRAVQRPVKVQWTREEEFRHNYVGPPYSTRIDAGLDASGRVTFWHHRTVGAPILLSSSFFPEGLHRVADLIPDPGTERGLAVPYAFTHHKTEFADRRIPMPTGPWRGLGAAPNTFAVERAMDELARAAGTDPIAFRLSHLDNPRLATCLTTLASKLEAETDADGELGVAAAVYKGVTSLAVAARVRIENGRVRCTRLYCVHDCGQVIAPDQVRAQIEGNLVWGVGMALSEQFDIVGGAVRPDNFDRYAVPRQSDVPPIDITLIDSTESASGAAEAALAPAAAAVANAVQSATGVAVRRLPVSLGT